MIQVEVPAFQFGQEPAGVGDAVGVGVGVFVGVGVSVGVGVGVGVGPQFAAAAPQHAAWLQADIALKFPERYAGQAQVSVAVPPGQSALPPPVHE